MTIPTLVYIGSEHELSYNKTRGMHEVFSGMPLSYRFVDITATSQHRIVRLGQIARGYWRLFKMLRPSDSGGILWLSEFKFAPWHAFMARLVANLRRMTLVGGPHVLSDDRLILKHPALANGPLTKRQSMKLSLLKISDIITLTLLHVLQTYSESYGSRMRSGPFLRHKPTLFFPITLPSNLYSAARQVSEQWQRPSLRSPLRIGFWGVPTSLHGIDTLVRAVHKLSELGVTAHVTLFASMNQYVSEALQLAKMLGISESISVDEKTRVSGNFNVIQGMHVAVSHLVSECPSEKLLQVTASLGTNKVLEIWALGLPALVAHVPSTEPYVGTGMLATKAGDPDSVVRALLEFVKKPTAPEFNPAAIRERAILFTPDGIRARIYKDVTELAGF